MRAAVFVFLLFAIPQDRGQTQSTDTAHYQIVAEGYDGKEAGLFLEELYKQLTAHFGKAPGEKQLKIDIRPTRDKWVAAMKADGLPELQAGGYYSPLTKKAYLFMQPSDYYTRQLILHEATHQFHYLTSTGNGDPTGFWYREGIAEYFGMHSWDGTTLKTGVVPAVSLEDYPAQALAHLEAMNAGLEGWLGGTAPGDRPEGWALCHFLIKNHPAEFRALSSLLDQKQDPLKSWKRAFGKVAPETVGLLKDWVTKNQQPIKVVYISWQERGDAIEGKSDYAGLAVYKKTPAKMTIEIEGRGNVVFGFKSPEDFYVLRFVGKTAVISRHGPATTGETKAITDGKQVVKLEVAEGKWKIDVNGTAMTPVEAKGDVGFQVESGRALFRVK